MDEIRDITIIGYGPAGMSAMLYSSRSRLNVLAFDKGAPGGMVLKTKFVENYLGVGVAPGFKLGIDFYKHSLEFGGNFKNVGVSEIKDIESKVKKIILENGEIIQTYTIIISTGLIPRRLDLFEYDKFFGKGLSTCLVCDGALFKDKEIVVVGGSNSAIEESTFSASLFKKITILNIEDFPRAEKIIIENMKKKENINLLNNTKIKKINGSEKIDSVLVINVKTKKEKLINASAVFTYIGYIPQLNFLKSNKILNEDGYIEVDHKNMSTKIQGVFAAGDIIAKKYRQLIISTSEGAIASLSAQEYLSRIKK